MWSPRILLAALFITIASSTLVCLYPATASAQASSVVATTETDPVGSIGDAADDAAVWVNAFEPSLSTVIGTDNESGLSVYDLDGTEIQHLPDGKLNNVDIRYRFPLAGQEVALVTAGERSANLLAVYTVDPVTRELEDAAAGRIVLGIAMNGCCMYRSPVGDEFYFFGNSKAGEVEQWRLFDDGAGMVDAELVRSFDVGGQVEGCAADDENAFFFIAEESVGIWRYGAEPGDGVARVQVDTTSAGGQLSADVEGLTIYYAAGGDGYLLASSQGSSTFTIYERGAPHTFLASFEIGENAALGIDAVSGTDGIEVMNMSLGAPYPNGVFVAQDDVNPGDNQNYKLVGWEQIAASTIPPLVVDADFDVHGLPEPGPLTGLLAGIAGLIGLTRLRT